MGYRNAMNEVYTTSQMRRKGWATGVYVCKGSLSVPDPVAEGTNITNTLNTEYVGNVIFDGKDFSVYSPSDEDIEATDWQYFN